MSAADDKTAREQRLAAKLRENLHRRKAQARAQGARGAQEGESAPAKDPLSNDRPKS